MPSWTVLETLRAMPCRHWVADKPSVAGWEIERWRANQFRDFAGARLDVRVPVGEQLLNDTLDRYLLPHVAALRSLNIRIEDGNRLTMQVASARWSWLPAVTIPLEIEPNLLLDASPVARLRIAGAGIAATLAPLMRFITLPDGVRVADRLVEIDINSFLSPLDAATLSEWLQEAHVATTDGTLWIEVRLGLSRDEAPVEPRDPTLG